MKLIYRIFLTICICSVVGFILFNSTRTGTQSSQTSSSLAERVVPIVAPEIIDMQDEVKEKAIYNVHVSLRNVAHVVEYALLAFFVALLTFTFKFNYGRYPIAMVITVLACSIFAVLDELLQNTVSGRMAQIGDVAMDAMGVVIGVTFALIMDFIVIRIIKKRKG